MLDLLKRGLQLPGALRNHFFKMLPIILDLLFEFALMQSEFEACHNCTLKKRFDEVVVRARSHRLYAHVHIIYASGDQERHIGMPASNFREKLHAANAGHAEIGDDRVKSLAL